MFPSGIFYLRDQRDLDAAQAELQFTAEPARDVAARWQSHDAGFFRLGPNPGDMMPLAVDAAVSPPPPYVFSDTLHGQIRTARRPHKAAATYYIRPSFGGGSADQAPDTRITLAGISPETPTGTKPKKGTRRHQLIIDDATTLASLAELTGDILEISFVNGAVLEVDTASRFRFILHGIDADRPVNAITVGGLAKAVKRLNLERGPKHKPVRHFTPGDDLTTGDDDGNKFKRAMAELPFLTLIQVVDDAGDLFLMGMNHRDWQEWQRLGFKVEKRKGTVIYTGGAFDHRSGNFVKMQVTGDSRGGLNLECSQFDFSPLEHLVPLLENNKTASVQEQLARQMPNPTEFEQRHGLSLAHLSLIHPLLFSDYEMLEKVLSQPFSEGDDGNIPIPKPKPKPEK